MYLIYGNQHLYYYDFVHLLMDAVLSGCSYVVDGVTYTPRIEALKAPCDIE